MLFYIVDLGVFAHIEGVDAVVLGGLRPLVVDAAAGDDDHVAVRADEEVVVDQVVQAGLRQQDRDMDGLVLGAGLDVDVDAGLVLFGDDVDVCGGLAGVQLAVLADVIGPLGGALQVSDLL